VEALFHVRLVGVLNALFIYLVDAVIYISWD
jgi:hypothetical protein